MVQQRLPIVNSDNSAWGDLLNQYISKEHYNNIGVDDPLNGSHKTITVRPGTTAAATAPLKFNSGPLMSIAEVGAIEFLTDRLYFTNSTGAIRNTVATYDDSLGATGDLHYRDATGNFVRLPIGSTSQVLSVAAGLPAWSSSPRRSINTISSPTTAGAVAGLDYTYFVSGTTTLTLPTAVSNMNMYSVTNTGVTTVTVATTSAQTINGSATATLPIPNMSLDFISNGSNWVVE